MLDRDQSACEYCPYLDVLEPQNTTTRQIYECSRITVVFRATLTMDI